MKLDIREAFVLLFEQFIDKVDHDFGMIQGVTWNKIEERLDNLSKTKG